MKSLALFSCMLGLATSNLTRWATDCNSSYPTVSDKAHGLTYNGVYQSGVEAYLGIQYGRDTSGQNRYKPPQPYTYKNGSTIAAQSDGPACPQPLGDLPFPLYLSNITEISENCLLLNVKRPNATTSTAKLPVMVFIHGDSFIGSSKDELVSQASGLILESVANGYPVMHVSMNYRLGSFGFAQSTALRTEGSLNAGLRDQRLAIEWVKDNIAVFGGNPNNITIFGQSSGGLAVGMQIMAYGASKPVPFQQAICESQALEGGITGNFTRMAMTRFVGNTTCNTTDIDSASTLACLRSLSTQQLLDAQTNTYSQAPSANIGDEWLPVVDGDFLPEAPSSLIYEGKFANVTTMIGWADGDANFFPPMTIKTANDTNTFLRDYLPGFNTTSLTALESLYSISEFSADPLANLSAEFFRAARIMRDIIFTCMPIFYGQRISARGNDVYLYDQNQTFLNPALTSVGLPNLGPVHTSEFAYVFGNLSHYDVDDFPFLPNATDYALLQRESRSWSTFAATGKPSIANKTTLQGWTPAFPKPNEWDIFVIGGPQEGLFNATGSKNAALNGQKLDIRCTFLNSPDIIEQLNY